MAEATEPVNSRRRLTDLGFALLEKLLEPIAVPAIVLLLAFLAIPVWFVAVDAGWLTSKSQSEAGQAVKLLNTQQWQLTEMTKAIAALTASVQTLSEEQKRQTESMREMWCYGFVTSPERLKLCLGRRD